MGKILDGNLVASAVLDEVRADVEQLALKNKILCLAVILVGNNPASNIYVRKKQQACERVGIKSIKFELKEDTEQKELLSLIARLSADCTVHGILCQLPLPNHIDEQTVLKAIAPEKDVDAFSARISICEADIAPCTPAGIVRLIEASGAKLEGSDCVVVGRSNIVGKPLALLLLQKNATVTVCHSKTKNLADITKAADILVVAAGCPNLIGADMVKDGAVVIDVGINRAGCNRICGDVDFMSVLEKAAYVTPVPGGVGPMTIAMLMKNTLLAAKQQLGVCF